MINGEPEDQTVVVGAAPLVKASISTGSMHRLDQLGLDQTIDRFLKQQPEVPTTYGALTQVIIVNRLSFQPPPLYQLGPWTQEPDIHRLFNLVPAWLDDDRLGAMLEVLGTSRSPSGEPWARVNLEVPGPPWAGSTPTPPASTHWASSGPPGRQIIPLLLDNQDSC